MEREDRVALAERNEVAPLAAELDERRRTAEQTIRHLDVAKRERPARRDVERVAAVVGEGRLVCPVDAGVVRAFERLRVRRADERDAPHLAGFHVEAANTHPV